MTSEETATSYGPPFRGFRIPGLRNTLFELRPISVAPERMVSIMYRHNGETLHQSGVGQVKTGHWVNTAGAPLDGDYFWTVMVDG